MIHKTIHPHGFAAFILLMLLGLSGCMTKQNRCGLLQDPGLSRQERRELSACETACVDSAEGECSQTCWKRLVADRVVAYLSQESRSPTLIAQPDWQNNQLQVHLGWTLLLPEDISAADKQNLEQAFDELSLEIYRVVDREVVDAKQFFAALAQTNHGVDAEKFTQLLHPSKMPRGNPTLRLAIRPGQAKEEDGGVIRAAIGQQSALYEDEIIDLDGFNALSRGRSPIAAYVLVGVVDSDAEGNLKIRLHFGVRHELVFTTQRNADGEWVQGIPITTDRLSPDTTADIFCKAPCQAKNTGGGAPKLIVHPWPKLAAESPEPAEIGHTAPPVEMGDAAGRIFYRDDEITLVRGSDKFNQGAENDRAQDADPTATPSPSPSLEAVDCPFDDEQLQTLRRDISWHDATAFCDDASLSLPSSALAESLSQCPLEAGRYWTSEQSPDPSGYTVDGMIYESFEISAGTITRHEEELWSRARNALCLPNP